MTLSPALGVAREAARAALEKKGEGILALDVRGLSSVVDCFVFVGAHSHIHVRTIEDAVRSALAGKGVPIIRTDGQRGQVWRVLDYGSVLIHIMDQKTREFYGVERLWNQGRKIAWKSGKLKRKKAKK